MDFRQLIALLVAETHLNGYVAWFVWKIFGAVDWLLKISKLDWAIFIW